MAVQTLRVQRFALLPLSLLLPLQSVDPPLRPGSERRYRKRSDVRDVASMGPTLEIARHRDSTARPDCAFVEKRCCVPSAMLQTLLCTLLGIKTDCIIHRVYSLTLSMGDFQISCGFLNPLL